MVSPTLGTVCPSHILREHAGTWSACLQLEFYALCRSQIACGRHEPPGKNELFDELELFRNIRILIMPRAVRTYFNNQTPITKMRVCTQLSLWGSWRRFIRSTYSDTPIGGGAHAFNYHYVLLYINC